MAQHGVRIRVPHNNPICKFLRCVCSAMVALCFVSSVALALDVDAVFQGSVVCCASKQSFPHPAKDKQLCRFSTKPAAEQNDRQRRSSCTFDQLKACTSCGLAFFDGRRQGLAGLLATNVFDLKAPVTVLRRLSKDEELVEVSIWDPKLVRSAQVAGGQVSARLQGLTTRGLEAEMQCLHSPGCSPRFEVAASEWSKVMALDFVVQNDDRLDTSRCGVSHPLFHSYENLTTFGSALRGIGRSSGPAQAHKVRKQACCTSLTTTPTRDWWCLIPPW